MERCRLKRKRWLKYVQAEMNGTFLTAIAVFLVIGMHFESHLPDRQGELNYFLIDHSFPLFGPYGVKWTNTRISITTMPLASSTLTSYSVHFIWTMFGIQLTGQRAAKGRWGSGSVINYRQISSYKDPSPLEHHFSWCVVNLINQQLSPHN